MSVCFQEIHELQIAFSEVIKMLQNTSSFCVSARPLKIMKIRDTQKVRQKIWFVRYGPFCFGLVQQAVAESTINNFDS